MSSGTSAEAENPQIISPDGVQERGLFIPASSIQARGGLSQAARNVGTTVGIQGDIYIVDPGESAGPLIAYDPEAQGALGTVEYAEVLDLLDTAGMDSEGRGNGSDERLSTWNALKLASARVADTTAAWEAHQRVTEGSRKIREAVADSQSGDLAPEDLQEVMQRAGPALSQARIDVGAAAAVRTSLPAAPPDQRPFMFMYGEGGEEPSPLTGRDVNGRPNDEMYLDVDSLYHNLVHTQGHQELKWRTPFIVTMVNDLIKAKLRTAPGPSPN